MSDLIKITKDLRLGDETVNTVNARELHEFLESKRQFGNWISKRIDDYNFVENQDFVIFNRKVKNSGRGRPAKEYFLSVDMAKELSMVERNEKGRQARRYFIECERRLKRSEILPVFGPPTALAYKDAPYQLEYHVKGVGIPKKTQLAIIKEIRESGMNGRSRKELAGMPAFQQYRWKLANLLDVMDDAGIIKSYVLKNKQGRERSAYVYRIRFYG